MTLGLVLFLLNSCASVGPPGGGPEDKTSPTILMTYPPPEAVKVDPQTAVEITFSEAVDPVSCEEALFISPTPEDKPKLKWRGRDVRIKWAQSIPSDRTTVITLGTGIKDLHGNRLSESLTLAFTAGDSIDRGIITGSVFGADPVAGMLVGAWPLSDTLQPNPAVNTAPYFTQVSDQGKYVFGYLKPGVYRVFCWNDKNRDRLYNPDAELLGIAWRDAQVDLNLTARLDFQPVKRDTSNARLLMVSAPDNRHLILRFNRVPEETAAELKNQVLVADSLGGKLSIREAWTDPEDSTRIHIQTVIQSVDHEYWVTREGDSTNVGFTGSTQSDTTGPQTKAFSPKNGDRNVTSPPSGWVAFDDALLPWNFEPVFSLSVDSLSLPLITTQSAPHILSWKADTLLPAGRNCKLQINLNGLRDFAGNLAADTVLFLSFSILDLSRFGSISGTVDQTEPYPIIMTAQLLSSPKSKIVQTPSNPDGSFKILNLTPGLYRLGAFQDADYNRIYYPGSWEPFAWAERFIFLPDTIQVQERWETGGIILHFKE
ncbi:MAG: Ig-like domain-containing protein [Calditrichota bacterium]